MEVACEIADKLAEAWAPKLSAPALKEYEDLPIPAKMPEFKPDSFCPEGCDWSKLSYPKIDVHTKKMNYLQLASSMGMTESEKHRCEWRHALNTVRLSMAHVIKSSRIDDGTEFEKVVAIV